MNLFNPFAFGVLGDALPLSAPPALRPQGGDASELQRALAQATYAKFCVKVRLSKVPNPSELGRLADGTPYRIDVLGPQAVMQIWPQATTPMGTGNSGVVFDKNSAGRIWLLTNTPSAAGESTAKWGFRDITDSQKDNASGLIELRNLRLDAMRIPGDWKYAYRDRGLGRYGHPGAYEAPWGSLSFITQAGKALFVAIEFGSPYIQQFMSVKKITEVVPPVFGGKPPIKTPITVVTFTQLLAEGVVGPERLPLPGNPYFTCSEGGEYLAAAIRRRTGATKSWIEGPYDGPDKHVDDKRYWAGLSSWPFVQPINGGSDSTKLQTYVGEPFTMPATYRVEEILAQKYKAGEGGYTLQQAVPIGTVDSSGTSKVVELRGDDIYVSRRFGLSVQDQVWSPLNLITSVELVSEDDSRDNLWRLEANNSNTFRVTLKKDDKSKTVYLEGVDSSGNLRTFTEEYTQSYLQKLSRPATSEIATSVWLPKGAYPMVGDVILADSERKNQTYGTFHTDVKGLERTTRRYMDGLVLDILLVSVEAVNDGDFFRDLLNPSRLNTTEQYSSTTTYRSRVEQREVLLRDPLMGLTVYLETIVTLEHQSSESHDSLREGAADVYIPSTELPFHTQKVWIVYRDQRISWDVGSGTEPLYDTTGYANIGRAISKSGKLVFGDGSFYFGTGEPIWPMPKDSFESNVDFVADTDVSLVQVYAQLRSQGISAKHAKCPETGAMLLRVAGRAFLIDKAAGVRDARGVLPWPPGLEALDFYPF